uniref:MTOR-associated protein MEAK7 isoform X2 n=1 Tax=Nyctereutes procyonoides TaxID=34880 RepID=UPI00244437C7|nr:MTOR-associated protein MEAK7 isoform X2 [Nyctereutes procyonoides]
MGNVRSQLGQKFCSQFLPEEQAEIDRLFDALSSEKHSSDTSPRSFSLKALKSHIGEALPLEMVTRLYDGMRRVDLMGKAKGPSESISREQFTMSMSHLLKGNSEEKSLMILKMISATEGPVKAREIQKFTEDLVGSVVHVLSYRQELRGWTPKTGLGPPPRVQVLAAQLFSEMDLRGGEKLPGPQQLDCECDLAMVEAWVFRVPHVATFLSVVIHRGFLLRLPLDLATLVPERHVDQERVFESVLDILSVIYINSHLPREQRHRWRLLFSSKLHGHSFTQLCGHITQQGPCIVLVEDHDGHVFGGFASCSWEVKPQFQGFCSRSAKTHGFGLSRHSLERRARGPGPHNCANWCCVGRQLGHAAAGWRASLMRACLHSGHFQAMTLASCSPSPPTWPCTRPRVTTTTTCT